MPAALRSLCHLVTFYYLPLTRLTQGIGTFLLTIFG